MILLQKCVDFINVTPRRERRSIPSSTRNMRASHTCRMSCGTLHQSSCSCQIAERKAIPARAASRPLVSNPNPLGDTAPSAGGMCALLKIYGIAHIRNRNMLITSWLKI